MKVTSTSPVSVSRVKELLQKRADDGEELGYEQDNALEHATEFSDGDSKKVSALATKLKKELSSLTDEVAMKLAEIQPTEAPLVKAIALYSKLELSDEDIETVLKTIKG